MFLMMNNENNCKIGLPFEDDNLQKLFDKIARADYHFPKDFPPLARDLVSKMLTVDVKKRITIPMIKKHPWFKMYEIIFILYLINNQRL